MPRQRVPGYITKQVSNDFGLDVRVSRRIPTGSAEPGMYPSGDPVPEGKLPDGTNLAGDRRYRELIPPGTIGSEEGQDLDILSPPQYIDTVPVNPREQNDPRLHNSTEMFRQANPDAPGIPFQSYATFEPRSAPMPRAAQDQVYLEGYGRNAADPRMTDESSELGLQRSDRPDRAELYGHNRDGVLHNQNMMPSSDTALYHPVDAVSESERANLAKRRGLAAAEMPHGEEQKGFIARQGDTEAVNNSRVAYRKMSLEAAQKGH